MNPRVTNTTEIDELVVHLTVVFILGQKRNTSLAASIDSHGIHLHQEASDKIQQGLGRSQFPCNKYTDSNQA